MTLRSKLIRLAHANPALRPDILPLLKEAAKAPAKLKGKELDELISKSYNKHGDRVVMRGQINMMSIPKIHREALAAYEAAATPEEGEKAVDEAMKASIAKYRTD
jgi:hypothetical protein